MAHETGGCKDNTGGPAENLLKKPLTEVITGEVILKVKMMNCISTSLIKALITSKKR